MDILAHGIWAYFVSAFSNLKLKKNKLKNWLFVSFGVMPDFVSFAPMFVYLIIGLITGNVSSFPRPEGMEPATGNGLLIHNVTGFLYNFTHSIIMFAIVFLICMIIFRRPVFELLGWLVHILIDIPTHSYQFYPTPFLWPVSGYKYNGISWGQWWFMILNYSALIAVYFWLRHERRKK